MGRAQNLMAEGKLDEVSAILCHELELRTQVLTIVHPRTIAVFNAFGVFLRKRGDIAQARRLLEELDRIAANYPPQGHSLRRAILQNLGTALYSQGYMQSSQAAFERALAIARENGTEKNIDIGTALTNLAFTLEAQNRDTDAEAYHRRALELRTAPDVSQIERAASLNNLGANLTYQKRFSEAQPLLEESLMIREMFLDEGNLNIAFSLTNLAMIALEQGRNREAVEYARRAVRLREHSLGAGHPETALAYQLLARAELATGANVEALTAAREALKSSVPVTLREAAAISNDARTAMRRETSSAAFLLTRSAWALSANAPKTWTGSAPDSLIDEAFVAAQRIPASTTADAFGRATARAQAADKGMSDLARAYELAEDARTAADRAITEAVAADLPASGAMAAREAAELKLQSLRSELAARFPDFFDFAQPQPVTMAKLLATPGALEEDDALIVMSPGSGGDHGLIWVVTREGGAWSEIAMDPAALQAAILALHTNLDLASGYNSKVPTKGPSADFDRTNARALYNALFGSPQIASALAAKRHWILVPQGMLVALPFATLAMADNPPADGPVAAKLRKTIWLGLERALSILPVVSSLASRTRARQPSASTNFFGVGDPSFTGPKDDQPKAVTEYVGERGGRVSRIQELPALPDTKPEIEALAHMLGASRRDYLLGDEASEAELRRPERAAQMAKAAFVAFATHGLVSGDLRNSLVEPALALTPPASQSEEEDGLLTSSEVASMTFNADLVLLSACRTAAANTVGGEGLTGLARAFFAAGAHSLLVSHWRVRDDIASRLTVRTVELMRRTPKLRPANALRRAMADIAADPASDKMAISLAHPAIWGAFMIVGAD